MSPFHRFFSWLAGVQAARPWLFLLIALATAAPSYWFARNLALRTGFDELLPDDQPSVIELRRTSARLATPKLRSLDEPAIVSVDDGPREVHRFFEKHKHLYADLADLEKLRAFIETGGAVVACSMTTRSGYAALLFSENGAIRSLGLAAGLGELATQLAAMLVLPAWIQLLDRRRTRRAEARAAAAADWSR